MSAVFIARRVVAVAFFVAAAVLTVQLVTDLNRIKVLKTDLAEVHHVRYGLLDADEWVDRISAVIEKRVSELDLTEENRPQVVKAVEQVLDTMLTEIERYLRRRNLRSGGSWMDQLQGALQQGLQDMLIDFRKLRRQVPQYAEIVVDQLSKPEVKEEIKAQLTKLIRQTSDATFAKVDRSALNALMQRYGCADRDSCTTTLETRIDADEGPLRQRLAILFALILLLFLLCISGRAKGADGEGAAGRAGFDPFKLFLLTGATVILLLGGILTPMIEIQASITELQLTFLDEPIVFTNQVLYFQTKSIFEVVRILVETRAADMLLVAVLITLFSVIFPAIKVMTTYLYYFDLRRSRSSALVRFFALRSGKWSMADVLVIAIFMAYLGFDGLIGSQLRSLTRGADDGGASATALGTQILTTNGTALEPGFYLFLGFVLASLFLSATLERHFGETHPS
ncbi:paraquat-inducible protein A [Thiorhodococcus minor]|uniref:Paraquat-inducible protein A n=1 Tax=Thiorhodococcus minor TaxID=57489 RepID=A0A6M0K372_9GAMM|nr:paraquat-inducible protein A [Thiorhodococcus minor]NEV63383.1 paraquat-inducible protein A [Thiorhodococcus minor]